jgi:CHAT domain-containing protein/tetratricopeptide (TPR) repeat protein
VLSLLLAVALLPAILAPADGEGPSSWSRLQLPPGASLHRQLAVGEKHRYELVTEGDVLVSADEHGLDLALELEIGGQIRRVEAPVATVRLHVPQAVPTPVLTVIAQGLPGSSGSYRLNVERWDGEAELLSHWRRAAVEASLAGEAFARGSAGAQREALAHLETALAEWRAIGREREVAWALLASAETRRGLGDARRAVEDYPVALASFRALGLTGAAADSLDGWGLALGALGESEPASALFRQALELRRAAGDRAGEAVSRNNLCLVRHSQGALEEAAACYQEVLATTEDLGRSRLAALVRNNLGGVYELLGEPFLARDHYQQALATLGSADPRAQAQILSNLGVVHRTLGNLGEALVSYERALGVLRELGDRRWEARILNNLGMVYLTLGDLPQARGYLEQALTLRRAVEDRRGEAVTRGNLARLLSDAGDFEAALTQHQATLELWRDLASQRGLAATEGFLGETLLTAGKVEESFAPLERSLELARELGDRQLQGRALRRLGEAHALRGELDPAAANLAEARGLYQQVRHLQGETETTAWLAWVEGERGRLQPALELARAAVEGIETLRTELPHAELRAQLVASLRRAYETYIDLLLRSRGEGEQGPVRRALEVSEQARARSLLDLLEEAGADLAQAVPADLREREAALRQRIHAKVERRLEEAAKAAPAERVAALDGELRELLSELDRVEVAIRHENPRYAALTQPRWLGAGEIQSLLGPDTLLLEVALGETRSYLWAVTAERLEVVALPGRKVLEDAARRVHGEISVFDPLSRRGLHEATARLSSLVLGPVAGRLGTKRLLVVADGALHYVPFAALPLPVGAPGAGEPVLVHHEVVQLPSVSTLALLRRQARERPPSERMLVVLADPVFELDDPRLARRPSTGPASAHHEPLRQGGGASFPRLPATSLEAGAIAALLPPGQARQVLGFEARREAVVGRGLAEYRWVHLATHGVIDTERPELSGLLFSRYDAAGTSQEGFLSLDDVYGLDLGAELVVLSGCETALGRVVRGEGLVGLVRGFLHAGAERVLASLWRVQDRATAELMTRFYHALLVEGRPPAAALRQAQLSILGEPRWADPFFWAPFVLVGDWS